MADIDSIEQQLNTLKNNIGTLCATIFDELHEICNDFEKRLQALETKDDK